MKEDSIVERLVFLAEKFDVFECYDESVKTKLTKLSDAGYDCKTIYSKNTQTLLGIVTVKLNSKDKVLTKVSVCSHVFDSMIEADPTMNKMYLQWMLNVFTHFIKSGGESNLSAACRFVDEDLPQASKYLQLFEDNKRKKIFANFCKNSFTLMHVTDPTNINQYKSLAQLFDAVDPFIVKEPSAVERTLQKFVDMGQAEIPMKDRRFTLYIPRSTAASSVFASYANWCTAREGNGMFTSYTNNHKKPNGKNSDIYIIIDNKFFSGESKALYQIHFETNQIKDNKNGQNVSIFESVLEESEGLTNYFYTELMEMAKGHKTGIVNNRYLDYLVQFGFAESLFELIDAETPTIREMAREIPRLPDISRFTKLDQLIITGAKLVDIHPSIGKLVNLEMLVLAENRIKSLPKEIGLLTKLTFLNLTGNPITEIPDEIKYLDKSKGGSLHRLSIKAEDIGEENYQRLKELLPTTHM